MTGKRYYLTTRDAWQRHAARFANSHWVEIPVTSSDHSEVSGMIPSEPGVQALILVLVDGDEGAHLALEDDVAFEALPHPFSQKPIADSSQAALASLGVASGVTTFEVAEAAGCVHPLLRPRVF